MSEQRTYPHGVPCWVDTEQIDLDAASRFYGGLFGWSFEDAIPAAAPGSYLIATCNGSDVAAIGPGGGTPSWNTYIAVENADTAAAAVVMAGGVLVTEAHDAGPGGRTATCLDPAGAEFRLWQARRRPGAQAVNAPGSWNFSNLCVDDPDRVLGFYATVFGWVGGEAGSGIETMLRVPGYGDHLAQTADPDIYQRQAAVSAPTGFADVVAGTEPLGSGDTAHWQVKFSVTDRDESAARAERLGATIVSSTDTPWAHEAVVRDPQGAEFSLSQFAPSGR